MAPVSALGVPNFMKNAQSYDGAAGDRIKLVVRPEYGSAHAVSLKIRDGWNESCSWKENTLSLEELHDLRHLVNRAIAASEIQGS